MKWRRIVVSGCLIVLVIVPTIVTASIPTRRSNTTWERSAALTLSDGSATRYGALGSVGDARFFSFDLAAPTSRRVTMEVPVWTTHTFHPQIIIYQPDTMTVGPAVPVVQPPNTVALVYPSTSELKRIDHSLQMTVVERLATTINFPVAGRYYLAVYNADHDGGRFRLTLTEPGGDDTQSFWSWPRRWWVAHIWASASLIVAYLPAMLLLMIVGVVWISFSWHRSPRSTHRRRKV